MRILVTAVLLAASAIAGAAPCPPGRFVPTEPLLDGTITAVVTSADGVGLEGCDAAAERLRVRRRGTRMRARWDGCGATDRVRVAIRLSPRDCSVLVGRLRQRGQRPVRFTALRTEDVTTTTTTTTTSTSSSTTTLPGPPGPGELTAAIAGPDVVLVWNAPAPGFTDVRLLRRLDEPPADAHDPSADLVYAGAATNAVHPVSQLLPSTDDTPRTYHYALFGCVAGTACDDGDARATLAPTLVQALRGGGYVLHWRHASATVCADATGLGLAATTAYPDWWKRCDATCPMGETPTATARQLNDTGVAEATAIGQTFAQQEIPVGRVVSSEFCRNVTTAELMAFGPAIEQRQDVTFFVYDEAGRCDASYALITAVPAAGTNTAVIGHAGFTCPVLQDLAWAEAAVFRPDGTGSALFIARVPWNAW